MNLTSEELTIFILTIVTLIALGFGVYGSWKKKPKIEKAPEEKLRTRIILAIWTVLLGCGTYFIHPLVFTVPIAYLILNIMFKSTLNILPFVNLKYNEKGFFVDVHDMGINAMFIIFLLGGIFMSVSYFLTGT